MNEQKKYQIKKTLLETKSRRKGMSCKVFELKVDESKLSKKKEKSLEQIFREAKWIYNAALNSDDVFKFEVGSAIKVKVFNPKTNLCDVEEIRPLSIGSQIKQSLVQRIKQNIVNLSKTKAKGLKVGALKFKKEINSIPLKQFGTTFKIGKSFVSVQNIGKIKVNGLHQIRPEYEIANATLVKKASGYYILITIFEPKSQIETSGQIGLDFGIKDAIVDSNGIKFNCMFNTNKIKRDCRRFSKKKKGSKNKIKAQKRLGKSYEKITRQKDDAANKFVSTLKKYEKVVIQDENLKGWQAGLFGKQVQESILGRIKAKIKNLETSQVINRFFPTTQLCPKCEIKNKIPLSQRDYSCCCGFYHFDRDIKAAQVILTYGIILVEPKTKPAEKATSFYNTFSVLFKSNSLKQEASIL
jgi:transposase